MRASRNSIVPKKLHAFTYIHKNYHFQLHWNNPLEVSGTTDASGMKLYITPNLRKYDLGTLTIGPIPLHLEPGKTWHWAQRKAIHTRIGWANCCVRFNGNSFAQFGPNTNSGLGWLGLKASNLGLEKANMSWNHYNSQTGECKNLSKGKHS